MLSWMLLALAAGAGDATVAVPEFRLVGIDATLGGVYVDRFATQLSAPRLEVTTQRDIQQLLGFERQKQLLGCADDGSSCLAELAGALGVQALVSGSVAKTESGYLVTLRLLRTTDGAVLESASERLRDEAALLDFLDDAAPRFRDALLATLGDEAPRQRSLVRWVPGMVGGALAVAGGVSLGIAFGRHQALVGGALGDVSAIDAAVSTGRTAEAVGYALVGVGLAGVVASFVWAALGDGPAVALVPMRGGAALSLSGCW